MAKTNHINIADDLGRVYCEKTKDIEKLDERFQRLNCASCPFYNGSAQGQGVECVYDDPRYETEGIHSCNDPGREQRELSSKRFLDKLEGL